MVWLLARRTLRRSLSRTVLLVAGVTIAGALLFDMSMLGGGLERSLALSLGRLHYELRVLPAGTLPFATETTIPDAGRAARRIAAHPDVAWAAPLLGTTLYAEAGGRRRAAFAYGLTPEIPDIVRVEGPARAGVVVNRALAEALDLRPGDTLRLATRISPQTGAPERVVTVQVGALGEFAFDLAGQRTLALPLADLQALLGAGAGEASLLLVKVRPGADPERVAAWIEDAFPALDALSVAAIVEQIRRQLTYFAHFATVLSAVSLLVAFLLIGAVLTLAVGERLGELAALRAIGLARARLVLLILVEGLVVAGVSTPLALLLGAAISDPLDAILRSAPGVPRELHFFVGSPAAVARTVALLLLTGTFGAAYPAWVAGRLNVAATLHREVQ